MDTFETIHWGRVLGILLGGAIAWIGVRQVTGAVKRFAIHGDADLAREKRALTLVRAVRYVLGIAVALVVTMLLLSEFGISIAPLLGAAGVAGVAIGLAAQGIAKDFLRGFSLLFDNQIRVGDVVEIAGKSGSVEEVTLRHVKLREYDGTVHFVRTGEIDTVTNRSYGGAFAVLDVAIDSSADAEQAMRIVRESADSLAADATFAARVTGPVDVAGIDSWNDDAVILRARLPVTEGSQAAMRREWLARVKAGFDREAIPNPTQRLLVLKEPPGG